jgi:hypothetical protein
MRGHDLHPDRACASWADLPIKVVSATPLACIYCMGAVRYVSVFVYIYWPVRLLLH